MRKITIKLVAFLLFTASAVQVQAQAFPNADGTFRIKIVDEDLYITAPSPGVEATDEAPQTAIYAPLDADAPEQVFTITGTGQFFDDNPDSTPTWTIFCNAACKGLLEYIELTAGTPVGFKNNLILDDIGNGSGEWGLRGSGTQLFNNQRIDGASALRRITSTSGNVIMGGGFQTPFDFIEVNPLNITGSELASNNIFVSNPIRNNTLKITTSNVKIKSVSVYDLLGARVLTQSGAALTSLSLNASSLASGMYIVKIDSEKGVFSTKILK